MVLPHDLFEAARPKPVGERSRSLGFEESGQVDVSR